MDQTLELLLSRIDDQRKTVLINLGDGAAKDFASYPKYGRICTRSIRRRKYD
jgi:hypothetical protein